MLTRRVKLNPECLLHSEPFRRGQDPYLYRYNFGALETFRLVSLPEYKRRVKRWSRATTVHRWFFDDPCNAKHVIENPAILEKAVKGYKGHE